MKFQRCEISKTLSVVWILTLALNNPISNSLILSYISFLLLLPFHLSISQKPITLVLSKNSFHITGVSRSAHLKYNKWCYVYLSRCDPFICSWFCTSSFFPSTFFSWSSSELKNLTRSKNYAHTKHKSSLSQKDYRAYSLLFPVLIPFILPTYLLNNFPQYSSPPLIPFFPSVLPSWFYFFLCKWRWLYTILDSIQSSSSEMPVVGPFSLSAGIFPSLLKYDSIALTLQSGGDPT